MTRTAMPIHPVRTREDHRAAVARIEALMHSSAGTPEADELDILATLVEAFEANHDPIDLPEPLDVIRFRMDQQLLSRKDLAPMIGSRGRVSEVLSGRRPLTLPMIRRLAQGLDVSADLLIGRMEPERPVRRAKRPGAERTGSSRKLRAAAAS